MLRIIAWLHSSAATEGDNINIPFIADIISCMSFFDCNLTKISVAITGLGKRAVALLIVHTDGFRKISNYRQLVALTGLAPKEYTSGSFVRGKRGRCKMGNGHLRSVLYMCALTAIKYNKACKDLYQRLKSKGKNGKVALIVYVINY
jgi:transposase